MTDSTRGALRSPSQLLGFAAKNEGAEMLVLYSVLQRWDGGDPNGRILEAARGQVA